MEVLFVCRENIGRSQMAEAMFNRLSKKNHAQSCGTKTGAQEGRSIEDAEAFPVIGAMKDIGFDVSKKVSKKITKELFESADKVIVMVDKAELPEYAQESDKVIFWQIEDMAGMSDDFHRQIRDEIKEHVKELIKEME